MGRQSAKIVVVQDAATRAQLTRMNAAVMGTDSDPMYGAPTILVVLADAHANCAVQDGSLVMGNLMLAAASLGLGSCWINRAREEFDSAEGKAQSISMAGTLWNARWRELTLVMATGLWEVSAEPPATITIHL